MKWPCQNFLWHLRQLCANFSTRLVSVFQQFFKMMALFFVVVVFLHCESFSCLKIISVPHEVETGEQGGRAGECVQSAAVNWGLPGFAMLSDDFVQSYL